MALFDRLFGTKPEENLEDTLLAQEGQEEEAEAESSSSQEAEPVAEDQASLSSEQEAQKQRTLELMERYYAEKAALANRRPPCCG